jgi:hypothetical protein
MKSPKELGEKLAKQWQQADHRETRLLSAQAWPVDIGIGKPTSQQVLNNTSAVSCDIECWKQTSVGEVIYQNIQYRGVSEAVSIPIIWRLRNPSEWIKAIDQVDITNEYQRLGNILSELDRRYSRLLIRQRSLWLDKNDEDIITAGKLADQLEPGMAAGRPLRLMSGLGVDTKFFERHSALIEKLLDVRYDGAVTEHGMHHFLGAPPEKDHWLLVKPLQHGLLPYQRMRLTSSELAELTLPANRIIVIENERCEHLLPDLPGCIAILGAGFDLQWLSGQGWANKKILYWGDMDTWGLKILSQARQYCPTIQSVLMNRTLYERHYHFAVHEPVTAQTDTPAMLTTDEAALYQQLLMDERGRLEQEFIPHEQVVEDILVALGHLK